MKKFAALFVAVHLGIASSAIPPAEPASCPQHFAGGMAPELLNQRLAEKSARLCFEGYAVLHSGLSRTPLWSAEYLDRRSISAAEAIKRRNTFHPEEQLPPGHRAELRDYARSGWDRGHMSPAGDMPTATAQYESFSLANIIPQDSNNNQNLWASIEEKTRALASRRGKLFVITGPIFEGKAIQRINGRVLVPTHVFKAIYDPERREAAAYIAMNQPGAEYRTVSIAELEKRININLFPALPAQVKQSKMSLPAPAQRQPRPRSSRESMEDEDFINRVLRSFGIQ